MNKLNVLRRTHRTARCRTETEMTTRVEEIVEQVVDLIGTGIQWRGAAITRIAEGTA